MSTAVTSNAYGVLATNTQNPLTVGDEVMIELRSVHKWYGQFHVLT